VPKIGLVVDGVYDQRAIAILLRKCGQGIMVVPRQCGGGQAVGKAIQILRELARPSLVDFAIWATDSETEDPTEVEARMRKAVKDARLNLDVCCVPVVPMMEAWLLADEVAVEKVCGASRKVNNPETLPNPKANLRDLLRKRPYTSVVAERIAQEANVAIIAKRCPSFRKLKDCVAQTDRRRQKRTGRE